MSDVIGSAEIEIRATRKKLKQDADAAAREIKQATKAIENAYGDAGRGAARQFSIAQRQMQADARRTADALGARYHALGNDIGRSMMGASRTAQIAFAGIVAYSLKAASQAEDIGDAFDFTFSAMGTQAEATANKIASDFKRTTTQVKGNLSTMYQVLTGMGLDSQAAFAASAELTSRSLDLASQKGISDARAFEAVLGGITGETEPLKHLGVVLSEAAVKAELARMGLKGGAEGANEAQKAAARLNLILAKTATAQGDVARTSESAANKAKELQTEFQNAAVELGTQLLPAFVKVAGAATDTLKTFNGLPDGLQIAGLAMLGFVAAGGPIVKLVQGLQLVIATAKAAQISLLTMTGVGAIALTAGYGIKRNMDWGAEARNFDRITGGASLPGGGQLSMMGASDADIARALAFGKSDRASMDVGNGEKVSALQAEADKRAKTSAASAVWRAQRDAEAAVAAGGGLTLPPGGTGGGGGRSGRAGPTGPSAADLAERREALRLQNELAVAEAAGDEAKIAALQTEIDLRRLVADFRAIGMGQADAETSALWQQLQLVKARGEAEANIIKVREIDQNPDGFVSSADRLADATAGLDEARAESREAFREAFTGGLLAALDDSQGGISEWMRQGAERGLEQALNNLADLIFSLFSQAMPSSGGGGGFWASAASAVAGAFGFGGARAYGGPVTAGKSYLVGEHGPEILRAPMNGMIIPNGGVAGAAGGGNAMQRVMVEIDLKNEMLNARIDGRAGPIAAGMVVEGVKHMQDKQARAQRAAGFGVGRR